MIRAIVTDIEGTTSSLAFVKDVLFPHARAALPGFVAAHGQEPEVRALLDEVRELSGARDDDEVVRVLQQWIDEDRKVTPLKALQGMIWEAGYRDGEFTGHVYPDAAEALRRWADQGIRLYVYSSGSVPAQQLLFGHSDAGDLRPLFSGWFDTRIGGKREADAYRRIVEAIGLPAEEILFLSDVGEELDAARAAGMRTLQLVREPAVTPAPEHPRVSGFADIDLQELS